MKNFYILQSLIAVETVEEKEATIKRYYAVLKLEEAKP